MDNPSINMLKYRPFPELAAALRQRSAHIIERLQTMVKELLPSADQMTFSELRDQLPKALEEMAGALEATVPGPTRSFLNDATEHGVCRFHQSFNLRELLVEYSLLRTILIDEVSAGLSRPLTMDEVTTLNVGVDASSRRAVTAYVSRMSEDMQAAAEAQSKHLSFLSHDLRGNLNGILLTVEVLRRQLVSTPSMSESLEDLDVMRHAILDTVATMDRFLYAEKFRRGKVEAKLGAVDVSSLLHDMAVRFHALAREKRIELMVDPAVCPPVVSDRELILLILQNVVGNALKYTKQGSVRLAAAGQGDGGCRISITDTGPGIAPDQVERLFDAYTRGETHGQKGIGLGLSIAHQAADVLGAKLRVESQVGKGSTFHLDLPPRQA
jgi:signal transduction histidine kinase